MASTLSSNGHSVEFHSGTPIRRTPSCLGQILTDRYVDMTFPAGRRNIAGNIHRRHNRYVWTAQIG